MPEDLIKVDHDILEVISVDSDATGDNYLIEVQNEFGEKEIIVYPYTDTISLYVFIDQDEQLKFLCASPHKNARVACVRFITFKMLTFFPLYAKISL